MFDLDFGIFFFAAGGDHGAATYRLMLDSARRADELGLAFVSTPERHFHPFGGAFPNPAVTSAAIAAVTSRLQIRSGSVVTPLHHPARVVEDFAMVDNMCDGRVAISIGSGWNINDFVLAPEVYAGRRQRMLDDLAGIRAAWRSGRWTGTGPGGNPVTVELYPRPVQADLPIWLTASRSPETFRQAGELGVNLLTHLENQSVDALAEKIDLYRAARAAAGHDAGKVTVMMHTLVLPDGDEARTVARPWLKRYLLTAIDLEARAVQSGGGMSGGRRGRAFLDEDDSRSRLAEIGISRYFDGTSLIGSVEECAAVARRVEAVGADEIACLVDFVGDGDRVLEGIEQLGALKRRLALDAATDHALVP